MAHAIKTFLRKTRIYLSCMVNIMAADGLVIQGARASAAMVLNLVIPLYSRPSSSINIIAADILVLWLPGHHQCPVAGCKYWQAHHDILSCPPSVQHVTWLGNVWGVLQCFGGPTWYWQYMSYICLSSNRYVFLIWRNGIRFEWII